MALAQRLGAEIVSCDSMLVYRGMDIGTAKPTPQERSRVPHHLIDLAEPSEAFSVAAYQAAGREAMEGLEARGARPLIVGGSGLYFRALVDDLAFPGTDEATRSQLETEALGGPARLHARLVELDPVAAARMEPGNTRRIVRALEVAAITGERFSSFATAWENYPPDSVRVAGIEVPRTALAGRIEARVRAMVEGGFEGEVRSLVGLGFGGWLTSTQAIGYAEFAAVIEGSLSLDEAIAATVKRTKALARRQMAWFRRDPRIRWFESEAGAAAVVDEIAEYLSDA